MPTRLHANRKKRGHVSAGHGRIGKHRKHPGGRGMAGGAHHQRINMNKYHPGYWGNFGMVRFANIDQQHYPTVNVDELWNLIPTEQRTAFLEKKSTTEAPIIDVTKFGFFKVLGRGLLPKCPIIVRAKSISAIAEKRIKEAGGVVQLI